MHRCAAVALLVLLCATGAWSLAPNKAILHKLSHRRALRQTSVNFVPQGCQGLGVEASASFGYDSNSNPMVYGTVTLANPNNFNMPISSISVQLSSSLSVSPVFTTASCPSTNVAFNPAPYQQGYMTCNFQMALPSSGPAGGFSSWTSLSATATVGLSNAQCSSPPFTMPSPPSPPSGCQGITVSTYSQDVRFDWVFKSIQGTVVVQNSNSYGMAVDTVKVQISSNLGLAPLSATAICPGSEVSGSGQMECNWQVQLPLLGPGRHFHDWSGLQASATMGDGTSQCTSAVATFNG